MLDVPTIFIIAMVDVLTNCSAVCSIYIFLWKSSTKQKTAHKIKWEKKTIFLYRMYYYRAIYGLARRKSGFSTFTFFGCQKLLVFIDSGKYVILPPENTVFVLICQFYQFIFLYYIRHEHMLTRAYQVSDSYCYKNTFSFFSPNVQV